MGTAMEEAWWAAMTGALTKRFYAGFVDNVGDDFRLCTLNLSTGALTAVGNKVDISSLVGGDPQGCALLESGGTVYAGFVDNVGDDFRLATLNLSTGALTAVGSKVDISSLVGASPNGLALLESGGTVYAALVDALGGDFRLCTLNLSTGASPDGNRRRRCPRTRRRPSRPIPAARSLAGRPPPARKCPPCSPPP